MLFCSCIKPLNYTQKILINMIDNIEDNFDFNKWLPSMCKCINERILKFNSQCVKHLSEAYFYYGVISYANKDIYNDYLCENIINSRNAFQTIAQLNNPKEVWKLQVIEPLITQNNGWLSIFVKSELTLHKIIFLQFSKVLQTELLFLQF